MHRLNLFNAALLSCFAGSLQAATFVVDTTSSATPSACTGAPADCSLPGAVAAANSLAGADSIEFNIPTCLAQVCTIASAPQLQITDQVTIDGYTQQARCRTPTRPRKGG